MTNSQIDRIAAAMEAQALALASVADALSAIASEMAAPRIAAERKKAEDEAYRRARF